MIRSMNPAYENLGVFYLGRAVGADGALAEAPLLYDSRDLTTHAVCVGMTGSGKTGLCISILEEAAIDGIPAIVIDPKGDLVDLMLTFPDLDAASFRPWVNEDAARQQGITADALAAREAERWKRGLADWDEDGDRIRRLRDAAEFTVYTPGSDAGRPVSVVSSLNPPRASGADDADLLAERAGGVASSLLSLLGIEADPVRSREHILITTILQGAWVAGRGLDLAGLVRAVQSPPFTRVGVMEIESFFPSKERFALAMLLNNLLASPGFQAWLTGEALDADRLLYTESGKPRVAIFSIAHLDDAQRMFFVSLLLNEVVSWMRTRSGTPSLRAVVYMDEIFGYMPPVENPPSKKPLLTLMKQARAFGVGVVLATQNPVDLDYKALSNAGTWFVGRLQTERDKKRLADGLSSVSSSVDAGKLEAIIGSLEPRTFLLHNVHEDEPIVFRTRWALSYLAGPLTRAQIRMLPGAVSHAIAQTGAPASAAGDSPARSAASIPAGGSRPVLPADLPQLFEASASPVRSYVPFVLGEARVHVALPDGSPLAKTVVLEAPLDPALSAPDWSTASPVAGSPSVTDAPVESAAFASLPASAGKAGAAASWKKSLTDAVYRGSGVTVFEAKRLRLVSKPDETERDFRVRIADALRADRDARVDALRAKYASRLAALEDRIRRAETAVARERDQATNQTMQTAVSLGATLLTAFLGRKALSQSTIGRATTTARGASRVARERSDVAHAQESVAALQRQRDALANELETDVRDIDARGGPDAEALTTKTLRPKKSDIEVLRVALLWRPAA
jgi:Helicase HerA, central domain